MAADNSDARLIVIVGQTASGKSALAMELARRFNGEIIAADSRTVYKGMDIGTAKPTAADRAQVKHHLLDVVEPGQRFTVANFKDMANKAIKDINERGKLPIMVGGTGLYVDAVLFDYQFAPDDAERDAVNPRHLAKASGRDGDERVSDRSRNIRPYTLIIGLSLDKEPLQKRVVQRVELMLKAGFIDEVKRLIAQYGHDISTFSTPGYKPMIEHLNGTLSLEEAKARFIKNDLNFAKRQKTWFKRNKSIQWVSDPSKAVELATTFLYRS